jgi:hypothetical protein
MIGALLSEAEKEGSTFLDDLEHILAEAKEMQNTLKKVTDISCKSQLLSL